MGTPWKHLVQEKRREAAEARNKAWAELGPKKQLEALDTRLGNGVGAKKQRARLMALLTATGAAVVEKKQRGG